MDVARNTVLEAYEQLFAEGYLHARHGSGTTVAQGISPLRREAEPEKKSALCVQGRPCGHVEGGVDFRSGIPALEAFPQKEWGRCYHRACESLPASALRYCGPGGVWELREAIAAYLFRMRGIRVPPRRVMVTSGATQGLSLVSRLLYRKDATVLVEDPMHMGLVEVVARAGYAVQGIRADEHGMETSVLQTFGREEMSHISFIYVTPSHQYPLGGILPIQRRQALIRFAQENACLIVEDDYDSEFRYEGAPVSSLHELAPETVVYLGSFSKILAPALRLGFAIVPDSMVEAWNSEKMYTDVHTDALSQYALAGFINTGGLERHIWKMKKLYKRKRKHVLQCLEESFGARSTVRGQAAGLHLVAGFSGVAFSKELMAVLHARGVKAVPVERYSLCGDERHAHEIILGYSHLTEEEITKGIGILRDTLVG